LHQPAVKNIVFKKEEIGGSELGSRRPGSIPIAACVEHRIGGDNGV
jgi:hypothetical protein